MGVGNRLPALLTEQIRSRIARREADMLRRTKNGEKQSVMRVVDGSTSLVKNQIRTMVARRESDKLQGTKNGEKNK